MHDRYRLVISEASPELGARVGALAVRLGRDFPHADIRYGGHVKYSPEGEELECEVALEVESGPAFRAALPAWSALLDRVDAATA